MLDQKVNKKSRLRFSTVNLHFSSLKWLNHSLSLGNHFYVSFNGLTLAYESLGRFYFGTACHVELVSTSHYIYIKMGSWNKFRKTHTSYYNKRFLLSSEWHFPFIIALTYLLIHYSSSERKPNKEPWKSVALSFQHRIMLIERMGTCYNFGRTDLNEANPK